MEKNGFLSNTNLDELHKVMLELDQQLASLIKEYMQGFSGVTQPHLQTRLSPHVSMDYQVCVKVYLCTVNYIMSQFTEDWDSVLFPQRVNSTPQSPEPQPILPISETRQSSKSLLLTVLLTDSHLFEHTAIYYLPFMLNKVSSYTYK